MRGNFVYPRKFESEINSFVNTFRLEFGENCNTVYFLNILRSISTKRNDTRKREKINSFKILLCIHYQSMCTTAQLCSENALPNLYTWKSYRCFGFVATAKKVRDTLMKPKIFL